MLTPDGTVPTAVPAGLGASLGGAAGTMGTAAHHTAGTAGAAAASGGSMLRKLAPLLVLLLLGFLAYRLFTGDRSRTPQVGVTADTVTTPDARTPEPVTTGTAPAGAADAEAADADPEAAVDAAMRKASDALAGLQPGYGADELVSALNLNIINFASGSAEIPAESRDVLDQSAKAIAGAPDGTVLEVGGHTDNTGSASANERLSARRAEAVRQYLVQHGAPAASLKAKGYGSSNPVADNDTEAGRFRNRRIEFQVVG
jgi:outer membrane protein OmpA-like peptidoglycan-associated protein